MQLLLPLLAVALVAATTVRDVQPVVETEPLKHDVDDPAIWRNPEDPAKSLIVATVKRPRPDGALAVYSLDGKLEELTPGLDGPNNVDIHGDLCLVTDRLVRQLRAFQIGAVKPHLRPLDSVPVFSGEKGESAAPMGIALYQRRRDNTLFAIVSRKAGPAAGYLWQYRLTVEGGKINAAKVRAFGTFSGSGEIEAVAVDPDSGLVYYADEDCCVRVYKADPDAPDASREFGHFAESGFRGDREGIAIAGDAIIVVDQIEPRSEYHVYRRDNWREIEVWRGAARMTDGIDALTLPMGPRFPKGFLVAMNNRRHNFHLYAWPR